jgi:hypothetical protein
MKMFAWILSACLLSASAYSYDYDLYTIQTELSHTEGSGIGYRRGLTSLDALFMARDCTETFYPFLDIKGHGFDNRKLAANFGMGFRYAAETCWIFGANLWYDLRQGDHRDLDRVGHCFHQFGFGLEAIGPVVDFRFNLYLPVGKKIWNFTQIHFNDGQGITPLFSFKQQRTFSAVNAEIGGYIGSGTFCHCIDWKTYLAFGPYLIKEYHHNEKWGVNLRLKADLTEYWSLEVRTGYDQLYLGSMQVKIAFNFPLYPLSSVQKETCCAPDAFRQLLIQPIVRLLEIMPLRTHHR